MATSKPRFLILRGGAIGDFIVTLPVFRALRERWPEAHLELVGYPHIAQLALTAGLVDKVTSLDTARIARLFSWRPQFPDEQKAYIRSFDLVFLFLNDPDNTVRENLQEIGAKQVIYGSPIVKSGHAVDHLLRALETLALYEQGSAPALPWPAALRERGGEMLRSWDLAKRPLALHAGSGSPKKNWAPERFAELARIAAGAGYTPFFVIGEVERDSRLDATLRKVAPGVPHVVGLELEELASVLSACERFAGNDSGITHLAAALGLPVVALFGPSDPAQWAPRGPKVRIVKAPGGALAEVSAGMAWESLQSV